MNTGLTIRNIRHGRVFMDLENIGIGGHHKTVSIDSDGTRHIVYCDLLSCENCKDKVLGLTSEACIHNFTRHFTRKEKES